MRDDETSLQEIHERQKEGGLDLRHNWFVALTATGCGDGRQTRWLYYCYLSDLSLTFSRAETVPEVAQAGNGSPQLTLSLED